VGGGTNVDCAGEPVIIFPKSARPVPGLVPSIPILFLASRMVTLPEELCGEEETVCAIPPIEVDGEFRPLPGLLLQLLCSTMTNSESEDSWVDTFGLEFLLSALFM